MTGRRRAFWSLWVPTLCVFFPSKRLEVYCSAPRVGRISVPLLEVSLDIQTEEPVVFR